MVPTPSPSSEFVALFALMLLRVPVGMRWPRRRLRLVNLAASDRPLKLVGQNSMRTVTDYTFGGSRCSC